LPNVVLHELMKFIDINDRLNLRITCRAFEKLMAESNAGYFDSAGIDLDNMVLDHEIGDLSIHERACNEDELDQFVKMRMRLFDRISFGNFYVHTDGSRSALQFLRQFMQKFEMRSLSLHVQCQLELENALILLGDFPRSNSNMDLYFVPETNVIRTFPRMERLYILTNPKTASQIPIDLFFTMLSSHKNLYFGLGSVLLTSDEWKKTIKVISEDIRERSVMIRMDSSTIVEYLRAFGISEMTKSGDYCGEFKALACAPGTGLANGSVQLRYMNCVIDISDIAWSEKGYGTTVTMTNTRNVQ
ncbi:hypothetical protein PENTCL1PPCAC_20466, partial [Pristionchus entomophagus]